MLNKKGAIEMSMSTIIVIVIGVTLLILGLAFVRGIFDRVGGLQQKAFDDAEAMLGQVEVTDEFLAVTPTMTSIDKGKSISGAVVIHNMEETPIQIKVSVESLKGKLECKFSETQDVQTDPFSLAAGDHVKYAMAINALNVGDDSCKITVQTDRPLEDKLTSAIAVTVK